MEGLFQIQMNLLTLFKALKNSNLHLSNRVCKLESDSTVLSVAVCYIAVSEKTK